MSCPSPPSSTIRVAKTALRKKMKSALKSMSEADRERETAAVTAKLLSADCYKRARSVSIYLSMNDEVGTVDILKHALESGKKCYIPRYYSDPSKPMEMARLADMADYFTLPLTKWNIRQPAEDDANREVSDFPLDLVLVPGLAFTAGGKRLGRGRGYYDAYLGRYAAAEKTATMALAFDNQVVPDLPVDQADFIVDSVISPSKTA